eukprot:scaffold2377_cov74-Phaeocystis_antarctica.AAC.6
MGLVEAGVKAGGVAGALRRRRCRRRSRYLLLSSACSAARLTPSGPPASADRRAPDLPCVTRLTVARRRWIFVKLRCLALDAALLRGPSSAKRWPQHAVDV